MTGHRIIASVACSYAVAVLGMTPANAADATRTRSGSSTAASASSGGSFTAYMELVRDGGALAGGPALLGAVKTRSAVGGGKNGQDCAREPFPCGFYEDSALFEAEQGPFSEALGNLEDYEATNPAAGIYCSVGNPPANCAAHGPGTGTCTGGFSLDAGDIQKGLSQINSPFRNTNNELLLMGTGFLGATSKYILPNYFGDSHDITFPNAAAPTGCQTTSPGPSVWGADLIHPFGTTGAIVTVTLENGKVQELNTDAAGLGRFGNDGQFVGFCCEAPILSVKILDIDGLSIGTNNTKFGRVKGACPVSFPPLTLEDINCALEAIEAKLDTGGPGGGGGCDFCEADLDAVVGDASHVRRDRDKACQHEVNGRYKQAEQTRCRMGGDIDAAEANGSITAAEATALRACLAAEQASRSDDPCN